MPESTVVREVKGRIRIDTSDLSRANLATQGFTKDLGGSMGSLSKQTTVVEGDLKRLANTHRSVVVPAHEATHGSITKIEESMHHGSIAIGQYGEKWEGLSRRLGGIQGLLGAGLGLGLAGVAGAAVAGLGIEYVKSAIENIEEQARAFESLHQAAEVSKSDYAQLSAGAQQFIQDNRAFIGNQYEAVTAMAMFTRAGLDQATATKALGAALDLANLKHIPLADAARMVQLAMMGNGRAVRELGIDLKSLTADMDGNATTTEKQAAILDEIAKKTDGGRSSITQLQQEQNKLHNTWQDLSTDSGPQLIQILSTVTGATDDYLRGLSGKSAAGKQSWKDINDLLVDTAHKWHDLFPPTPPTPPTPPLPGAAVTGIPAGVPGHPDMTAETAHQLGLLTSAELAHNVIVQRLTENQDRFGAAIARSADATQRAGEIADTTTGLYDSQDQELGRMAGHSNALRDALYDQEVAQGSLSTRTSEVIGKFRDESDQFTDTGENSRNQLRQTQIVYDGFVSHINSEHLDAAKLYVDYSDVEAAEARWNNLLYNVAVHRGELTANFVTSSGGGSIEPRQGGGSVIPGHIYSVGETAQETLFMGEHGGYVVPGVGGRNRESATPAATHILIDQPVILDGREIGRIVDERVSRAQSGTFR